MTVGKSREPVCSAAENCSASHVWTEDTASVLKVNHSGQFRSRKALSFTSFLLGPLGLIPEATELLLNLFHCGCLVAKSCLTLCDPTNCNTQGFPVLQSLQDFVQTHVHGVSDAIQPSHTLLPPSPPALDLS